MFTGITYSVRNLPGSFPLPRAPSSITFSRSSMGSCLSQDQTKTETRPHGVATPARTLLLHTKHKSSRSATELCVAVDDLLYLPAAGAVHLKQYAHCICDLSFPIQPLPAFLDQHVNSHEHTPTEAQVALQLV